MFLGAEISILFLVSFLPGRFLNIFVTLLHYLLLYCRVVSGLFMEILGHIIVKILWFMWHNNLVHI